MESIESIEYNSNLMRRSWAERRIRAVESYRHLRCLQIYIQLVNIVNEDLIFTWKLLSLGICITSGYATIAYFSDHPVFGVMYCVMFLDCVIAYTVVYYKALQFPVTFRNAKMLVQHRAGLYCKSNKNQRMILQRQLMSIPPLGIKVGKFHILERTSIPVFLDYVVRNVVSLLVAYK